METSSNPETRVGRGGKLRLTPQTPQLLAGRGANWGLWTGDPDNGACLPGRCIGLTIRTPVAGAISVAMTIAIACESVESATFCVIYSFYILHLYH